MLEVGRAAPPDSPATAAAAATVAASADAWKFRNAAARPNHLTVKDLGERVAAEYLRPIPAQSHYLDAATNPVPWPTRSGPRQPEVGDQCLAPRST